MAADIPDSLKSVKPFFIISKQIEKKDLVVSYHVKMYAVNEGIKTAKDDPAGKQYLIGAMEQLGQIKRIVKERHGDDAIDDDVAKAYLEEFADKLFDAADKQDRASNFTKNLSKTFFTASQIYVACTQFGELSEEVSGKMKYAKWKSVEINRCLQNGITPTPGPPGGFPSEQDEFGEVAVPVPAPSADQPGPSSYYGGDHGYPPPPQPTQYGDQPGPSSSYGNQPQPIGFDLPPVPQSEPSPQPRLPPEIKPVPKPRHEQPPQVIAPQPMPPQPQVYAAKPPQDVPTLVVSGRAAQLGPTEVAQAQKFCKFASSALEYDDYQGALDFLAKAMNLIQTGKENK